MACATAIGTALTFGISADEISLTTQRVTLVKKSDKKEARDSCGDVVSVVHYNKMEEVQVEGYGTSSKVVGGTIALTSVTLAYTVYIDEVTIDLSNEDYVKSTVKGVGYAGIG